MRCSLVIGIVLFLNVGCSKIAGYLFDESGKTDFTIKAYGLSKDTVIVEIPRTDHTPIKPLGSVGNYFYGYYIYISETSPYEDYEIRGLDSRPDYSNSYPEDYITAKIVGGAEIPSGDSTPGKFVHNCIGGKIYYYRVVVGYKKYNGVSFDPELKENGISGWVGALCPTEVLFEP